MSKANHGILGIECHFLVCFVRENMLVIEMSCCLCLKVGDARNSHPRSGSVRVLLYSSFAL